MRRPIQRLLLATALAALAIVIAAEGLLRHAGFVYIPMPGPLLIATADPVRIDTVADAELFWTLCGDTTFDRFATRFALNALGTRGALPDQARTPNSVRIVCLGDSTGFGSDSSYPGQLQAVLAAMLPKHKVEVINACVPGYTSFQGVRMLARLLAWRPDVVTFCFAASHGDIPADGQSDAVRAGVAGSIGQRLAARLRLGQWLRSRRAAQPTPLTTGQSTPRVSPLEHRDLLRQASEQCDRIGACLVAITQPHALRGDEGCDTAWTQQQSVALRRRHQDAANYALRVAAAALGKPLLDLATRLEAKSASALFLATAAGRDDIHTNPIGARVVAEEIAAFLLQQQLVPASADAALPPRFIAPATPIAMAAADRDGDTLDEVLLATTVDGAARAAWFDPRRQVSHAFAIDLPAPEGAFAMAQVPRLRGEVLITFPTRDGDLGVRSLRSDGTPGRLHLRTKPLLPGAADLRITPVDLAGDDRPEYVIGFGPLGPPALAFLTEDLAITAITACPGFDHTGLHLAAGRILNRQRHHLLIGPERGAPLLRIWALDRPFEPFAEPAAGIFNGPVVPVVGRFFDASMVDGWVIGRGPLLLVSLDEGSYAEPHFPFGGIRIDARAPALHATRVLSTDNGNSVWLGSRAGGFIHLVRIDGDTVSALPPLSCADAE